jgi:hypothetical protein
MDRRRRVDPDIWRVFHSTQVPPVGFNRGYFNDPQVTGFSTTQL